MFTGIIEEVGCIERIARQGANRKLTVTCAQTLQNLKRGDSVSVSGVCLTAVEITPASFTADLAEETWNRTSFSRIREGALVNLERPLRANGRFDGHIVQGHVDTTARCLGVEDQGSRERRIRKGQQQVPTIVCVGRREGDEWAERIRTSPADETVRGERDRTAPGQDCSRPLVAGGARGEQAGRKRGRPDRG